MKEWATGKELEDLLINLHCVVPRLWSAVDENVVASDTAGVYKRAVHALHEKGDGKLRSSDEATKYLASVVLATLKRSVDQKGVRRMRQQLMDHAEEISYTRQELSRYGWRIQEEDPPRYSFPSPSSNPPPAMPLHRKRNPPRWKLT